MEFLQHLNWSHIAIILQVLYVIFLFFLSLKVVMDTKDPSKTLGYLILIIFVPFLGAIIYLFFGVNYRKNKFYTFKIEHNEEVYQAIKRYIEETNAEVLSEEKSKVEKYENTIQFLFKSIYSPLTHGNFVEVLINGEEKFPKVLKSLSEAKHHIHLEYYIYENDSISNQISDILIQKAKEGVKVRLLFDDLGSKKIGKDQLKKLREAGVEAHPVNKVRFKLLANRVNYRDHRKIIIIDGKEVFTGGINVSDKYINPNGKLYWRDTHLHLKGKATFYFQYVFLSNWIFATEKNVKIDKNYFDTEADFDSNQVVQVAASGPDSVPAIMLSTVSAIFAAKKRVYITTPYFIPVDMVLSAIKQQAMAGLDVRLLVPKQGDSVFVNGAAYSYYKELLQSNVRIFFYKKGFVHAKTMLVDDDLAVVGTANMDVRSQELNFEINTIVYDKKTNADLLNAFENDLKSSQEIFLKDWEKRPKIKIIFEQLARMFSPLI